MDINTIVTTLAQKMKEEPDLLKEFQENPTKALANLVNIELPEDMIPQVVAALKTKLTVETDSSLVDTFKKML